MPLILALFLFVKPVFAGDPRCEIPLARLGPSVKARLAAQGLVARDVFENVVRLELRGVANETAAEQERVRVQLDEAAYFLSDFFIGVNGSAGRMPIREVVLVPRLPRGRVTIAESILYVAMESPWGISKRTVSHVQMRQYWDQGLHLDKHSPLRRAWPYLNPVGVFRTFLRTELSSVRDRILNRVSAWKGMSREMLLERIQEDVAMDKLGAHGTRVLENASLETLGSILEQWIAKLSDPHAQESLLDSAVQKVVDQVSEPPQVDIDGFITVGNFKQIVVHLDGSSGDWENGVSLPLETHVRGKFVAVYLVDHVDVRIRFGRIPGTEALRQVLERTP